jgi:hypothetical protein
MHVQGDGKVKKEGMQSSIVPGSRHLGRKAPVRLGIVCACVFCSSFFAAALRRYLLGTTTSSFMIIADEDVLLRNLSCGDFILQRGIQFFE